MNTNSAPWWASLSANQELMDAFRRVDGELTALDEALAKFRRTFSLPIPPDDAPNPIYEDESERAK